MPRIPTKIFSVSKIFAVAACLALIGYVGYLVAAQYRAQVALQESQRRQITQKIDKRANATGYFFSAQITSLRELAEAREIAIYFENAALGMSLEYGLGASLLAVQELFDKYRRKNLFEQHPITPWVLFLTPDGRPLALSGDAGAGTPDWSRYVRREARTYFFPDQQRGTTGIIISIPCLFKAKLVGQVICVIPLSLVYDHFVGDQEGSSDVIAMVMGDRYLFMPAAQRALLPPFVRTVPPRLEPGALTPLETTDNPHLNFLAGRTDIAGTPFSIIDFIPAANYDVGQPRRILAATAGMAVVILSGIFLGFILATRNTILKTRLEAAALREQEAVQQNRLLQNEITERQTAEQRLSLALKGGDLGLWDWDIQTNRLEFNDRWAQMLEYDPAELDHTFETFERLIHPDDLKLVIQAINEHFADSDRLFDREIRLQTKSGGWRWILTKGKVVDFDAGGKPLRMVGTHLDITRRKTDEVTLVEQAATLAQLNQTLEHRVQEEIEKGREKELLVLQNDKLASIGLLAAGVAHEINNPMGFITSNLRTLTKYFTGMKKFIEVQRSALEQTSPPELRQELAATEKKLDMAYILEDSDDLISESLEGAKRVARIVSDLKSFSRVDAPEYEETDLISCLESALNIVTNEIKYVATVVRETEPLPPVYCHPGQMNQVFMNLLLNARQAITAPGTITLRSGHDSGCVWVAISDDGHGIPEAIRDRIFEPFFTTKDVGKGTGLGLSISHDIISKHHGELLVESSSKGTTFTIKLPRNTEEHHG